MSESSKRQGQQLRSRDQDAAPGSARGHPAREASDWQAIRHRLAPELNQLHPCESWSLLRPSPAISSAPPPRQQHLPTTPGQQQQLTTRPLDLGFLARELARRVVELATHCLPPHRPGPAATRISDGVDGQQLYIALPPSKANASLRLGRYFLSPTPFFLDLIFPHWS